MIKHIQTITGAKSGNCMQTVMASLLDLSICQVPNFIMYSDEEWFPMLVGFLKLRGWKYKGHCDASGDKQETLEKLQSTPSINGYYDACVPSKNYPPEDKITHAVIIDSTGLVVHDPSPKQGWAGINAIDTGELKYWYWIEKTETK